MRYFLEKELIQNLKEKIKKAERIFLFLDYDGTLTSIQKTPDLALLSSSVRKTLNNLSSLPQMIVTIISGRAFNEISRQVNLDNLNYVGNHGLEIKIRSFQDEISQSQKIRKKIASFCQKIKKRTQRFYGILVENKGLTASIHCRLVKKYYIPELKQIVNSILSPFKRDYELREGKKVLEIRPKTKRNKGWAVNKIINRYGSEQKPTPVYFYFGDDLTDEDAFQLINLRRGYSVLVGKKKNSSQAHYYLKGPVDVHLFLTWLKKRLIQKKDE
jgi:trehalose-phosphatase